MDSNIMAKQMGKKLKIPLNYKLLEKSKTTKKLLICLQTDG